MASYQHRSNNKKERVRPDCETSSRSDGVSWFRKAGAWEALCVGLRIRLRQTSDESDDAARWDPSEDHMQ